MQFWTRLLALNLLCYLASALVVQQTLSAGPFKEEIFEVITKFITGPGNGEYSIKLWNRPGKVNPNPDDSITFTFQVYTLEDLHKLPRKNRCQAQRSSFSSHDIAVPLNGNEITVKSLNLGKEDKPQVWYFLLKECSGLYKTKFLEGNRLHYELTIKNVDGSHFSEEENGVMSTLLFAMIPLFLFLLFQWIKVIDFYFNKKAIDFPVLMLTFALLMELLAIVGEYTHLYLYSINRQGYFIFDWLNLGLTHLSQFTISILFLLMGMGWTLKPLKKRDEELIVVYGVLTAIIVCAMAVSSKSSSNDLEIFHDYQSWFGKLLILLKVVLYYLFLDQFVTNYRQGESLKVKRHFMKVGIFGSIYLLSIPLSAIISDIFLPVYLQHKVITYVTILVQSLTLLGYILTLSMAKDNEYYPIIYKNRFVVSANKII